MTKASQRGTKDEPLVAAHVPDAALKSMAARFDVSMPIGNEGAGVVVEAGSAPAAQALLGKTVAALGGAMYSQYRCVAARAMSGTAGRRNGCRWRFVVRQSAHRPRHGRDHAQRRPHGIGAHRGRLQFGANAQSDLHQGRDCPGEHRPQSRPGRSAAGDGRRSRLRFEFTHASCRISLKHWPPAARPLPSMPSAAASSPARF